MGEQAVLTCADSHSPPSIAMRNINNVLAVQVAAVVRWDTLRQQSRKAAAHYMRPRSSVIGR